MINLSDAEFQAKYQKDPFFKMKVDLKIKKIPTVNYRGKALSYIAFAGEATAVEQFTAWAVDGFDPAKYNPNTMKVSTILAGKDAAFQFFCGSMEGIELEQLGSIGSGGGYALALLRAGKSAPESVVGAKEIDAFSGGKVFVVDTHANDGEVLEYLETVPGDG